jgi:hypothetical protein
MRARCVAIALGQDPYHFTANLTRSLDFVALNSIETVAQCFRDRGATDISLVAVNLYTGDGRQLEGCLGESASGGRRVSASSVLFRNPVPDLNGPWTDPRVETAASDENISAPDPVDEVSAFVPSILSGRDEVSNTVSGVRCLRPRHPRTQVFEACVDRGQKSVDVCRRNPPQQNGTGSDSVWWFHRDHGRLVFGTSFTKTWNLVDPVVRLTSQLRLQT